MLWRDSEEVGNLAACVRKMKMDTVQTMMVGKVVLSGKGRWNLMYFVY
jgi:hypothetical protein